MSSEDQLVSFIAYSFLIYPITGYLVSPSRPYPRWQGAIYAIIFLFTIAIAHMVRMSKSLKSDIFIFHFSGMNNQKQVQIIINY